jgi:Zn-dependent protease with chaperone function
MAPSPQLDALVHPKERRYYALLVVVSVLVYALLVLGAVSSLQAVGPIALYGAIFALAFFMTHGLMLGRLRANGVRASDRQLASLYTVAKRHAATLGLESMPDIFVMQAGGALNAFATRFLGRDFVVVYSDVLAMAEQRGEAAVGFIVAHELAHVKRGHLRRRWLTLPGRLVPYLGAAYSRACEYTCDRLGAHCQPDGGVSGLLALAAGPALFQQVDAREYALQAERETGFFVRRSELMASHPHLTKRVAALLQHGVPAPAYTPVADLATRSTAAR